MSRPLRVHMWLEDTRLDIQRWKVPKARLVYFFEWAPVLSLLLKTRMYVTYWRFAVWSGRYWENSL